MTEVSAHVVFGTSVYCMYLGCNFTECVISKIFSLTRKKRNSKEIWKGKFASHSNIKRSALFWKCALPAPPRESRIQARLLLLSCASPKSINYSWTFSGVGDNCLNQLTSLHPQYAPKCLQTIPHNVNLTGIKILYSDGGIDICTITHWSIVAKDLFGLTFLNSCLSRITSASTLMLVAENVGSSTQEDAERYRKRLRQKERMCFQKRETA